MLRGGAREALCAEVDGLVPGRAVAPSTPAEVAATLLAAREAGEAVIPWGGGTHQATGGLPARYDVALDMRGLDAVRAHTPQDLTVTVEAGVTLARLQQVLAGHGQHLPIEVEAPERATIGGLIGSGVAGPSRLGRGTLRDLLLWTEVATPEGRLVRGGAQVVKSVAGYDTPKLHIGALGSLGVVTAACFRLMPRPVARRLVRVAVETPAAVGLALAAPMAAGLQPCLMTVSRGPAAWGGAYRPDGYVVSCGFEGAAPAVDAAADRLTAALRGLAVTPAVLANVGCEMAVDALMAPRGWGSLRVRCLTASDRVPTLLDDLAALPDPPTAIWAEAGNGVVRAAWGEVPDAPDAWWQALRRVIGPPGGTWVVEAAPPAWKRCGLEVWGPERPDWALMRGLKRAWDPAGVLAPGRTPGG
ncbi:MAG: FAD-binding oxidoreductase [Candidatus Sericytochromatia bacterium]|nr:FAD-binding oxidoreductase [Candidatus Sericytochromatia bacterium]